MEFSTLVEIIESAGYEPYSYSGRGMYGVSCVGFTVDREVGTMAALMDLIDNADCIDEPFEGVVNDLTRVIRYAQMDSMGLDTVIYFPRVKWVDED